VALALPGWLFAAGVMIASVAELRLVSSSATTASLGALAFIVGALSIVTTPLAAACGWFDWRRLDVRTRIIVATIVGGAASGWILFVSMYANPFFGLSAHL
jgi:hypothetical protein